MSDPGRIPTVLISDRQRGVKLDLRLVEVRARSAIPLCLQSPGDGQAVLSDLPVIEVALVSDRVIARVHRRFLNEHGATDVITFAHGELVVSATTAARQARELGEVVEREVVRYIIHGFLHLNGHEDADDLEAAAMWKEQEKILAEIWPSESQ